MNNIEKKSVRMSTTVTASVFLAVFHFFTAEATSGIFSSNEKRRRSDDREEEDGEEFEDGREPTISITRNTSVGSGTILSHLLLVDSTSVGNKVSVEIRRNSGEF